MATTSIFFKGRTIRTPGHYIDIDASGLEQTGLGATGIVAILGEAEGGIPAGSITDIQNELLSFTRPRQVRDTLRSGDLREAAAMAFEPSADEGIAAGAQTVVGVKVNPATVATGTLANAHGGIIDLSSEDYGAFNNQINATLANGTTPGTQLVTVIFEETTESADNVGGEELIQLHYQTGTTTWATMETSVDQASRFSSFGTHDQAGLASEITAWTAGPATAEIPANANNAGQVVTVYGLVGSTPTREQLVVSAGSTVTSIAVFDEVLGATMDADVLTSGVDIDETGAGTGTMTIAVGTDEIGGRLTNAMFVADTNIAISSGAAVPAGSVYVWGRSPTGVVVGEQFDFTSIGQNVRVVGTATFAQIDAVIVGDAGADTYTIAANVVVSDPVVQTTIRRLGDLYNAKVAVEGATDVGFTLTYVTGLIDGPVTDFDESRDTDVTIASPGGLFYGNLGAVLNYLNNESTLLDGAQTTLVNQVQTVTITVAGGGSETWTLTTAGIDTAWVDDGTPTVDEVAAGLIAAINASPAVNQKVTATAGSGTDEVVITSRFGASLPLATSIAASGTGAGTVASTTAAVGSKEVPINQGPVFLAGGSEGTTTFSDWQTALNLLKQVRVNTIVPLTGDPAVHAAAEAHCAYMGGIGKSERDCKLGLSALGVGDVPTNVLPTKASIKSQIVDLNSRHVQAFAQSVDRFNTAGTKTTFLPWFQAALAAGMQAGSSPGTSLTFKFCRVLGFNQDSSWNPVDDTEELIAAGLSFLENVEGVGRRFTRSVTTHLTSANIAYTDVAVNEAINTATFTFRNALEFAIGEKGFAGTLTTVRGRANNVLGTLMNEGVITTYRSLSLELLVDVLEISLEMAPTIPINFIRTVVHLVTVAQAA